MCEYIILEDFKIDKYIYDDKNGLWYELQGNYYIPCLTLPAEKKPTSLCGQRHKRYLQEHKRTFCITLLTSGSPNDYLAYIEEWAQDRMERFIEQMKQTQGITEQLKAENALEWIQKNNNI